MMMLRKYRRFLREKSQSMRRESQRTPRSRKQVLYARPNGSSKGCKIQLRKYREQPDQQTRMRSTSTPQRIR
eukprot:982246-Rhodomonas_salina.1